MSRNKKGQDRNSKTYPHLGFKGVGIDSQQGKVSETGKHFCMHLWIKVIFLNKRLFHEIADFMLKSIVASLEHV